MPLNEEMKTKIFVFINHCSYLFFLGEASWDFGQATFERVDGH